MNVYTCFVDLDKTYEKIPAEKLKGASYKYGIDGKLICPLSRCTVDPMCEIKCKKLNKKIFLVIVGVQQECVGLLLLFLKQEM